MKKENFLSAFVSLQKYFGKSLEDSVINLYWMVLKKLSDEQFEKSVENIINTFHPTSTVPFPLVSDFVCSLGISGENRAQSAVLAIKKASESFGAYKTVDFGDNALHAVINRFGGWPEISHWSNQGKWEFQEKNFMKAYIAAFECGEKSPPCQGLFELENSNKDQSGWKPIQIEYAKKASTPVKINWVGADFSKSIENKSENIKQIGDIDDLTKNIGKSF